MSLTEITPVDSLADYSWLAWRRLPAQMFDSEETLSMQATWVVVADCHRATIYTVPRGMARLRQVCELRESRISMDRSGAGEARSPDEAPPPAEQRAHGFAVHVALQVEDARLDGRFDELILVAAPTFLARLRESLSQAARDAVVGEIGKNFVGARQETLQEHVLRVL